jgi:hypothetical protein
VTQDQADEFLFFLRDEMLKNYNYNAEVVWLIPKIALNDDKLSDLVYDWYYEVDNSVRKNVENRIINYVVSVNQ